MLKGAALKLTQVVLSREVSQISDSVGHVIFGRLLNKWYNPWSEAYTLLPFSEFGFSLIPSFADSVISL